MTIRFASGVEVDAATLELRVGGQAVPVEPQVYDVLVYLIDHRERVVPKEELLDNVWGDRFVSESALATRIKSARRAVGDDGKTQAFIKTVHGRGYRWIAPLADDGVQADGASGSAPVGDAAAPGGSAAPTWEVGSAAVPVGDDEWPLAGRTDELEAIAAAYRSPDCGGVLLTGPAGVGKSRLAEAAGVMATAAGVPVLVVGGHAELATIPLGCLSAVLPEEARTATPGLDGELSRTLLVQRAVEALDGRSDGPGSSETSSNRRLLIVDDVERTDELTQAVLTSSATGARLFLVATQRTGEDHDPVFDGLLRNGRLRRIELGPIDPDALGVALYAALGRPIGPRTLERLVAAADGSPGICRQLVEQSIHEGTLVIQGGVWTLVGELVPPRDLTTLVEARLGDLDEAQRGAADTLALAGTLDLDLALDLAGEEELDALDLRGLLAVTTTGGSATVRLAHPMYGEVLRAAIPALRARRLKARLADAVEGSWAGSGGSADRLRTTLWRLESGGDIAPDRLLEAARMALVQRDFPTARTLTDRLLAEHRSGPAVQLDAELLFRQGRWEEVESVLSAVDLDAVDDDTRAQIVRRRAANMMWNRAEHWAPIELLEQHIPSVSGKARLSLESSWITLSVLLGKPGEVLARAERAMETAEGTVRLEVARAVAMCRAVVGRSTSALDMVDQARELAASMPPSMYRPGTGLLEFAELKAMIDLGRVEEAAGIAEARGSVALGWVPYALAWIDLYRGHPQATVDRLGPVVDLAEARGYDHNVALLHNALAVAEFELGHADRAVQMAEQAAPFMRGRQELIELEMLRGAGRVLGVTGRLADAATWMLEGAATAVAIGAESHAMDALIHASHLGAAGEAAELAATLGIDPEGVALRTQLDELRARAAGDRAGLAEAVDRYRTIGMTLCADWAVAAGGI